MSKFKTYFLTEQLHPLNEKTGAKVLRILGGQVPGIDSYALMTAENPFGEEHGPKENALYNKKLEGKLREMGLGFYKVKGKFFGNNEHSYLIPNISEEDSKTLGKEFGQESVIQGDKTVGKGGQPTMVHKYISGDKVVKTRKTFKHLASDIEDMFTQAKGKKFEVPFFDPTERGTELVGGKQVKGSSDSDVDVDSVPTERPEKTEFTKDKVQLLNTNDRIVWVNKENEKSYLNQGYKNVKGK